MNFARAAEFPERSVKLINATVIGATIDSVARILVDKMSKQLGQQVILDYKPGASGAIGASFVAQGAKDGHTMFIGTSSTLGFLKMVNKELPYDPVADFAPVAMVGSVPVGIFTNPASGINSIEDLVAAAKAKPEQVSYASNGPLTLTHLAGVLLSQRAGIRMIHVPYVGSSARYWNDLLGGQLQAVIVGAGGGLALAREGKVKLIGVASAERSKLLPQIPALGVVYQGLDVPAWFGLAVAAGTPAAYVQKLEAAALFALRDPATRTGFSNIGVDLDPILGARAFASKISSDNKMWEVTLKAAGLMT